jgi:hypothetical protein
MMKMFRLSKAMWYGGSSQNIDVENQASPYYRHSDEDHNIPVAHAVAVDSQDFARPPATNPSLYNTTGTPVSIQGSPVAVTNSQPITLTSVTAAASNKVISTRTTYTIPAAPSMMTTPQDFTRRPHLLRQCPECQALNVRTRIRTYPTCTTWLVVIVLLIVFWPLCWIPLVMDRMKQTDHFCLVCGKMVGSVRPFDNCCVKETS